MRHLTLTALGAAALFAGPAFAQTPGQGTSSPQTQAQPQSQPMSPADMTRAQQKITHDLTGDGFTNVHVVANSFLVHATNKRGEPVVMIINPNSVFEMTELPPGHPGTPNGAGHTATGGLGNSPTTKQ